MRKVISHAVAPLMHGQERGACVLHTSIKFTPCCWLLPKYMQLHWANTEYQFSGLFNQCHVYQSMPCIIVWHGRCLCCRTSTSSNKRIVVVVVQSKVNICIIFCAVEGKLQKTIKCCGQDGRVESRNSLIWAGGGRDKTENLVFCQPVWVYHCHIPPTILRSALLQSSVPPYR